MLYNDFEEEFAELTSTTHYYSLVPKAVELGIVMHMGRYFGLGNQLLMLSACLVVILLRVSGVFLWWQRRPAGRIGVRLCRSMCRSDC